MGMGKTNKTSQARPNLNKHERPYSDSDDRYFRKHFARLVREHGGGWIVLAQGKLIGVGRKEKIPALILKAQSNYPHTTPFIAPIPTKEELECVL